MRAAPLDTYDIGKIGLVGLPKEYRDIAFGMEAWRQLVHSYEPKIRTRYTGQLGPPVLPNARSRYERQWPKQRRNRAKNTETLAEK